MGNYVQFLRPYLQCWRCEKPFGWLQLMLFLYLRDHLCLRVRVRVRVWLRDLVGMDACMRGCVDVYGYIYIYTKKKIKKVVLYRGLCPPLSPWPTALRFYTGDSVPRYPPGLRH